MRQTAKRLGRARSGNALLSPVWPFAGSCCWVRDTDVEIRECCEPKLVRAKDTSPRREPWGNGEIHEAPERAEDCGAIFRPLRGLFRARPMPTTLRRGHGVSTFPTA